MPQSITIAAFVLGAILLLIGLLGGGFKIFGAEVTGNAGQVPRTLAGGLGALFIAIGLFGSLASTSQPSGPADRGAPLRASDPANEPSRRGDAPPPPKRDDSPPTPQEAPQAIGGEWRDEAGSIYRITQTGNEFVFEAYNPTTRLTSRGTGTLSGTQVTSTFQVGTPMGLPAFGRGSGSILDNGRTMVGSFSDSYYGQYSHTLTRVK